MSRPTLARLFPCLILLPALAFAGAALAADKAQGSAESPAPDSAAANLAFAAALEACVEASHQSPHPFMRDFVIEHTVSGKDGELCDYRQTMPGDMHMQCRLDEAGRTGLAAEFRELAEGRMSGGTGEQPSWSGNCTVITSDGERIELDKD